MCDAGGRELSSSKTVNPCPVDTASLAATPKRLIPVPFHLVAESRHCDDIAWHGVVGEVPSRHAGQPLALLGDRLMPPSLQLVFDLLEFGSHPFGNRGPPQPEPSVLSVPANVREAQEVERLRLPDTPLRAMLGRKAPKLDQASLVGVQLQAEPGESFAQIVKEPISVTSVFKSSHEVISEAHDDDVTRSGLFPPLPGPTVKDIVEVHVGEERRGDSSNAMDNPRAERGGEQGSSAGSRRVRGRPGPL